MNAEIKYFLHPGPDDSFSTYTRKPNVDLDQWKQSILTKLQEWLANIPIQSREGTYIAELSEVKYHNTLMLLLRPSPAIKNPSETALKMCYDSAVANLRIYNRLYKKDVLAYSWVTVHAVFLSSLTMLYYIWTAPEAHVNIRMDVLVSDLKASSDVLSATGEHWPQAKQCRDALENLSSSTIQWLSELKERHPVGVYNTINQSQAWTSQGRDPLSGTSQGNNTDWAMPAVQARRDLSLDPDNATEYGSFELDPSQFLDMDMINSVFGGPSMGVSEDYNGAEVLQSMFSDYQPTLDFLH